MVKQQSQKRNVSSLSEAANDEQVREMAGQLWSSADLLQFDLDVVKSIYHDHMRIKGFNHKRLLALELSQYLEHYLWPNFNPKDHSDCSEFILSIALMVNVKFRERVPAWNCFKSVNCDSFGGLFHGLSKLISSKEGSGDTKGSKTIISIKEKKHLLIFWTHAVNSIEVDIIRKELTKYISLSIWESLTEKRRLKEFKEVPKLKKYWMAIKKRDEKMSKSDLETVSFERKFMVLMIEDFFRILDRIPSYEEQKELDKKQLDHVNYCERFLDLMIDIESLLPTRRFFNALLDDLHVVVTCRKSHLTRRAAEGHLFNQLLDTLIFYARFEINDLTGDSLTEKDMIDRHYNSIFDLQKLMFKNYGEKLGPFCMSNISSVDTRDSLIKHFSLLDQNELKDVCVKIGLIHDDQFTGELGSSEVSKEILLEMISFTYERFTSQLQTLNEMPLYPTEMTIWDENMVPNEYFTGDTCLSLPKLNLQFLTLNDYLLRNFHLFRLESTYEIRQDIEDSVYRMKPWKTETGSTMFGGWARMALGIDTLTIIEVAKPNLGDSHPSRVRAEVRVNLNVRNEIKKEWEMLRKHDVCFLVSVQPVFPVGHHFNFKEPFIPQVSIWSCRYLFTVIWVINRSD